MLLAKHTKQKVTVALSGDGADEAFLGYHRYKKLEKVEQLMRLPFIIRQLGLKALSINKNNRFHALKDIIGAKNDGAAYLKFLTENNSPWLNSSVNMDDVNELKYLIHNDKNIYERAGDFDLKTYLSWDINTKVDRATMAYSLEARSPFLDYRVIEMAQSLPINFKYKQGNQKRILKDILYNHVPAAFFDRPKSGFGMPFEVWFRHDLKEMVLSELSIENLKSIPGIKPIVVNKMIHEHMKGVWNHHSMIWKLLVLKQWLSKNGTGYSIS